MGAKTWMLVYSDDTPAERLKPGSVPDRDATDALVHALFPKEKLEADELECPLAFHPLELGEEALKAFFGYQLEGYIDESLLDPESITLAGYRRARPWWKLW